MNILTYIKKSIKNEPITNIMDLEAGLDGDIIVNHTSDDKYCVYHVKEKHFNQEYEHLYFTLRTISQKSDVLEYKDEIILDNHLLNYREYYYLGKTIDFPEYML